jgi:thiol-disulfide isomerase/thioredoxin
MWSKYKRLFWIAMGIGMIGILPFGIDYLRDTSYEGDANIRFLQEDYAGLEEILGAEPFRDKVVYVDLWFSSCPPCIKEFKQLPKLKESLKGHKGIEYLYLSHKTRHPNTLQLWKNAIQKYNLTGWHYMMDGDFEDKLWASLNKRDATIQKGYPRYLIIDNTSDYRNYNAPKPSDFEAVIVLLRPLSKP